MPFVAKSKLPRLGREFYQGRVSAFWTHTFEHRATGWLHERFHAHFREVLLHTCARYALACPVYVLMPDHWHLIWMGLQSASDQRVACAFLRKHTSTQLGIAQLQDRAHDHVLRDSERDRHAFQSTCHYLRENPVRARLCARPVDWPYAGAMVAGYPALNPHADDFWERFWKIHARLINGPPTQASPPPS